MKMYIASSYSRKTEAQDLERRFSLYGVESVSGWLHRPGGYPNTLEDDARQDLTDIAKADVLLCITGDTETHGGRHTEIGIALALHKEVFIKGPHEQIFHHLCKDWKVLCERIGFSLDSCVPSKTAIESF